MNNNSKMQNFQISTLRVYYLTIKGKAKNLLLHEQASTEDVNNY